MLHPDPSPFGLCCQGQSADEELYFSHNRLSLKASRLHGTRNISTAWSLAPRDSDFPSVTATCDLMWPQGVSIWLDPIETFIQTVALRDADCAARYWKVWWIRHGSTLPSHKVPRTLHLPVMSVNVGSVADDMETVSSFMPQEAVDTPVEYDRLDMSLYPVTLSWVMPTVQLETCKHPLLWCSCNWSPNACGTLLITSQAVVHKVTVTGGVNRVTIHELLLA